MENHPIPQDVTGFQFKLIGNMTVKQFAYLTTGVVLGWIFLQFPVSIFIKLPFSVFFAAFGIGLAFFPIGGRPMDTMIGNFIKSLFRPTQFIYEKTGGQLYVPNAKASFGTLPFQQKNKIDERENNFLMSVSSLTNNVPLAPDVSPALNVSQPTSNPSQTKSTSLPAAEKPAKKTSSLLSKNLGGNIGLPSAPNSPNLITGITKDSRGNALANILIEVKDKEGNPVRAFKTNEMGRFASATPLTNGNYTIELEDPKGQSKFEKKTISVTGQIIEPIVAISIDAREELRRSLFSPPVGGLNN